MVRPGVTTKAIDKAVHDYIVSQGATPSFLHYSGYPASVCISVNDTVIHGIPDGRVLQEGDIVSVDVGAKWQGFHGDCAATYACGKISPEAQRLIDVTKQSFFEGVKFARQGCRISDIGHAVQTYAESFGCGVVRDFVGHGVGEHLHEEPEVPNYGKPGRGPRLIRGMVIAIEPMVNAGTYRGAGAEGRLDDRHRRRKPVGPLRKYCAHYRRRAGNSHRRRGTLSMELSKSDVVLSLAGRDQGMLFFVVGHRRCVRFPGQREGEKAGKSQAEEGQSMSAKSFGPDSTVAAKLIAGDKLLNSELRRELAVLGREFNSFNQGGFSNLAKDDVIELEGIVTDALPNAMFKVDIGGGHTILAHISGKLRMNLYQDLAR